MHAGLSLLLWGAVIGEDGAGTRYRAGYFYFSLGICPLSSGPFSISSTPCIGSCPPRCCFRRAGRSPCWSRFSLRVAAAVSIRSIKERWLNGLFPRSEPFTTPTLFGTSPSPRERKNAVSSGARLPGTHREVIQHVPEIGNGAFCGATSDLRDLLEPRACADLPSAGEGYRVASEREGPRIHPRAPGDVRRDHSD